MTQPETPATEPTATEPTATEPTATEPTATEPTATEPSVSEPSATEPAAGRPDIEFTPAPPGYPPPAWYAQPQVQYFQPPGQYLPQPSWRRNSRRWVWAASIAGAVVLAGCAIAALGVGYDEQQHFTATGGLQVDCATGRAVDGRDIGRGSPVRIYDAGNGELMAESALDRRKDVEAGHGACFVAFKIADLDTVSEGYLVEVGDAPGIVASRATLEHGLLLE